jgi:hypothetical protein
VVPLGVMQDEIATAELGEPRALKLLGQAPGTLPMVASAAVAAGALVYTAAGGKVQTIPSAAGTYYLVGTALTAASANNDVITVNHCAPVRIVIP